MRFNDTLHTVLAGRTPGGGGAITRWRQCVDLLAQYDRPGSGIADRDRDALVHELQSLIGKVPEKQRVATVLDLGKRLRSPALVRLFAADKPPVCAAAMIGTQLPDGVWAALIVELSPTARGILRSRRDLGPLACRALASFGAHDLVLTSDVEPEQPFELTQPAPEPTVEPQPEPVLVGDPDESQIRQLVNRIERFTSGRAQRLAAAEPPPEELTEQPNEPPDEDIREFSFETDVDGVIHWVKDAPRGQLIGMSIAQPPPYANAGPDGHVAGAFRHRTPFRNARFTIEAGSLAGEWRMSAIPYFNQQTGRFQGYRGHARRPFFHEMTATPARRGGLYGSGMQGESLRELIHELRTPLNAILGFAEIIDHQFFGPVSASYRQLAKDIIGDAQQLLATFDDLDLASRMERGEVEVRQGTVDAAALLLGLAARFNEDAAAARLDISAESALPSLRIDAVQAERMFQHLLRTVLSVAGPGEEIHGRCWHDDASPTRPILFSVDRPAALRGMAEADLFDPGYGPDGEWPDAPLLGIGFSLRLVRNLARGAGGNFRIGEDHFTLILPAMAEAAENETSSPRN